VKYLSAYIKCWYTNVAGLRLHAMFVGRKQRFRSYISIWSLHVVRGTPKHKERTHHHQKLLVREIYQVDGKLHAETRYGKATF